VRWWLLLWDDDDDGWSSVSSFSFSSFSWDNIQYLLIENIWREIDEIYHLIICLTIYHLISHICLTIYYVIFWSVSQSTISSSHLSHNLPSHLNLNNHLGDDGRRRDRIERDSETRIGNERDNLQPDDKFLIMLFYKMRDVRLWDEMWDDYFSIFMICLPSHLSYHLTIYHSPSHLTWR